MGYIQHKSKGNFKFNKQFKLPIILAKGINNVDLFTHHPMVDYYIKVPSCCVLKCEELQKIIGSTMNRSDGGLIGLDDFNSCEK